MVNHRWDLHELGERFADMLALPLELPPSLPKTSQFLASTFKHQHKDGYDLDIETQPWAAKASPHEH